jgi:hypothetical protein
MQLQQKAENILVNIFTVDFSLYRDVTELWTPPPPISRFVTFYGPAPLSSPKSVTSFMAGP